MKQFLITVAGVLVGFLLIILIPMFLLVMVGISAATSGASKPHPAKGKSQVLQIDLRQPMSDQPRQGFFGEVPSLIGLVEKLTDAENDDRVKGLFIRANPMGMGPVQAEQLRLAIQNFKNAGKFVTVHAQGFEGTSITSYLSVSAADEIWLQGTSSFVATGLSSETAFLGGVFEKIKAKPEFEQFYEYKNSANTFTEQTFTEAHRRATMSWISDIFDTAMEQIASDRGLAKAELRAITDQAPFSAEKAVQFGLADKLGYAIEAKEAALSRAGDGIIVEITDYTPNKSSASSSTLIALVEGEGAISTGVGSDSPFAGDEGIYSDQMAEAIIAATRNKKVKAILLRVDSPGGSAIASDQIWNAIERAKAKDIKVIVSMGQLAASGGYYISAGADAIVAYPTTITGSIGVLGGKIVLDDTFDSVGYNVEQLKVGGEFAGAYTSSQSFTESQRAAFRASMAKVYEDFTGKVADGRKMPIEQVLEIAKGRVWTGNQALENGLVDELGGYRAAIAKTKELLGLGPDDKVRIQRFPKPKTQLEQFYEMFGLSTEATKTLAKLQFLINSEQVKTLIKIQEMSESRPAELEANLPEIQ